LARNAKSYIEDADFVVPMIDARRMEVYCKVLNGELREIAPLEPKIIDAASFDNFLLEGRVFFLGDSNEKVSALIKHKNAFFVPCLNSSRTIGEIAYKKYKAGQFEDLAYFEPNYLKEFRVIKSKKTLLL